MKRINTKKKHIVMISILIIFHVLILSACGTAEVKEYKTEHDSGKFTVNSYADLEKILFSTKTLPEEISKIIPDFCIYGSEERSSISAFSGEYDDHYRARATVNIDGLCRSCGVNELGDKNIILFFNADKEFCMWTIHISPDEYNVLQKILSSHYELYDGDEGESGKFGMYEPLGNAFPFLSIISSYEDGGYIGEMYWEP